MQIIDSLEPFNWDAQNTYDGVPKVLKPIEYLDNGAMYEGEWHPETNERDGRGRETK